MFWIYFDILFFYSVFRYHKTSVSTGFPGVASRTPLQPTAYSLQLRLERPSFHHLAILFAEALLVDLPCRALWKLFRVQEDVLGQRDLREAVESVEQSVSQSVSQTTQGHRVCGVCVRRGMNECDACDAP